MKTTFRQIIQYDSELGHKYVPLQTACLKYGNGSYIIETDKNGFRNAIDKKTSDKLKIVCIGDSFTAGDGVSNKFRFTNLLEDKYDCEILNLGVSGYGVDQQLLAYEKYGKEWDHDIVLFLPHLDDLERNLLTAREGIDKSSAKKVLIPKPYYRIEGDSLVLKNIPVPKERLYVETEDSIELGGGKSPNNTLGKKIVSKASLALNSVEQIIRTSVTKETSYPDLDNENSRQWQITKPIINRLKQLVNKKPLFIFPIPYNKSVEKKETSKHYISIFKTFEDSVTKVFDLSEELKRNHNSETESVYLNICGHFSRSGNQIVEEFIANTLKRSHSLELRKKDIIKENKIRVIGISCFYHDSAACIIEDGKIIAAAQEERFTRVKHDKSFPINAINYCLEACKIDVSELTKVVYYDYESWTIERVLWNAHEIGELKDKFWDAAKKSLFNKLRLPQIIRQRTGFDGEILKCQHHISHAAGAYYPSPFKNAAILVIDGVGEWACTTIAKANGNKIKILQQQFYPHSLGLLYSAFTFYTGFKVNSGEYKLMGLAPYGDPIYTEVIKENIVDIKDDGSIKLNMEYFSFQEGEQMTNDKFAELFDGPARDSESNIGKREMDLAASIQKVTEEVVIKMANHAFKLTECDNLVMSGGVALNCVSNGHLYDNTPFKEFYFQPASGDAGGAMGSALAWYYENFPNTNKSISETESAYLGPEFSHHEILAFLDSKNFPYQRIEENNRSEKIASLLIKDLVIGYFDGRMEFGPRALGSRSIIGNPLNPEMQSKLNLKIKYRESFRPFAPIFLEERTSDYFDFDRPSPHMLIVRKVNEKLLYKSESNQGEVDLLKIINQVRSEIPAITHVDNSARLQSVNKEQNGRMHSVLSEFEKITGKGVLINTSFNVRGEPIVCTPEDAYKCFMRTEMDVLIIGDFLLFKNEQPKFNEEENWKETFVLD